MTQPEARIVVLEHEVTVLRGLRIGPEIAVAEEAVKRERELEKELSRLRREVANAKQPELFSVVEEEQLKVAED